MRTIRHRAASLAVAAVVPLGLTACGASDDPADSGDATTEDMTESEQMTDEMTDEMSESEDMSDDMSDDMSESEG